MVHTDLKIETIGNDDNDGDDDNGDDDYIHEISMFQIFQQKKFASHGSKKFERKNKEQKKTQQQ